MVKCRRCGEPFGTRGRCQECGVSADRRVMKKRRRQARIGGKRGHTSGNVGSSKKKK